MAGENYGAAAIDVLAGLQKLDADAAMAPVELAHKQALTQLAQSNAASARLNQELQQSGLRAMQGFVFDKDNPAKSMLEMGSRLATTQPVLAERTLDAASRAMLREQQAQASQLLMQERQIKIAAQKMNIMSSAYGSLPSTTPGMLGLARQSFMAQMAELGADAAEIQEAVTDVELAIKRGGPQAVEYLRKRGMTMAQAAEAELRKQKLGLAESNSAALAAHRDRMATLARDRENRMTERNSADVKAGKTAVDPRARISISETMKTANVLIAADPILSTGDATDKQKWAREVGQAAIEKVDNSRADRVRNPNLPLLSLNDALKQATDEIRGRVKQDPTTMGRLMETLGGKGATKAKEPAEVTKGEYEKLKKGDKYLFKGKVYTKE